MISKIVSGAQTGVDRAALDVALELSVPCGGWCPRGRRAEDGLLPPRYVLQETPLADYAQRTEWNVRDSDGTLILYEGTMSGGTALTADLAARYRKACLAVDLGQEVPVEWVASWLWERGIQVLNVAGPRESQSPGIYERARNFLRVLLRHLQEG